LLDRVLALERELESVTAKYARLESLIGEVLDAQDVRKNLGGKLINIVMKCTGIRLFRYNADFSNFKQNYR
jgi:hypothetical protein